MPPLVSGGQVESCYLVILSTGLFSFLQLTDNATENGTINLKKNLKIYILISFFFYCKYHKLLSFLDKKNDSSGKQGNY